MADPGAGGVYQTLGATFDPGYRFVYRVPELSATRPEVVPAFSDPRGILPGGLVPASKLSYELYEEVRENAQFGQERASALAFGVDLGFRQIVGQVTASSKSTIALIVFEGHDVIDLPTADLPRDGGGIVLPHNVFLPIFAGPKFFNEGDNLTEKVSLEMIKKSPQNQILRIRPSAGLPMDSVMNEGGIFADASLVNYVDATSNIIDVNGSPEFITYVAVDKLLYRDVIFLNTSAIGQGLANANDIQISFAGPFGDPIVHIYRYAFVEKQWKLAETFGVKPPKIVSDPITGLSGEALTEQLIDAQENHFAYDIKEAGDELSKPFPTQPLKQAYSPTFAKAKMDQGSRFHDPNFFAVIVPHAKNEFFTHSRLQQRSVFGLSPLKFGVTQTNKLVTERVYQSPSYALDFGPNTRIGVEHALHNFARTSVFGISRSILLAGSKPAAEGVSAFYDPCSGAVIVVVIEEEVVSQRVYDDKQWTAAGKKLPDSKLDAFVLGEIVLRSQGGPAIYPPGQDGGPGAGSQGAISIDAKLVPVAVNVTTPEISDPPPILELFTTPTPEGDPAVEIGIPMLPVGSKVSTKRSIPIPPLAFKSYIIQNAGSASVDNFIAAPKTYLEAMPQTIAASVPPNQNDALSQFQLTQLKAEDFPIKATSAAGAALFTRGHAFIAYEKDGRIDLAYRPSHSNAYFPVRDVCFRVPEEATPSSIGTTSATPQGNVGKNEKQALPAAGNPFLAVTRSSNEVFMFYHYKNRIVMKAIPIEIFTEENCTLNTNKFPLEAEARIAQRIQQMIPSVVYDGDIPDAGDGIAGDIAFGTLKVPAVRAIDGKQASIGVYSACRTKGGNMYCFIEDSGRIVGRRSSDNGETWINLFPAKFILLPPKGTDPADDEVSAPACYYDDGQNAIFLFTIYSNCLLVQKIPEQVLRREPDIIAAEMAKLKPVLIFGQSTDDIAARGIAVDKNVIDRKSDDKKESTSPHRVSAVRPEGGHLRVYFLNDQNRLTSLISSDGGQRWQSDRQYRK